MSHSSITLFAVSFLLLVCLSASHIVKRKAPDGQLYVFSNREGCESVQSEAPCTLTWKLNPYLAKVYKQSNEIVAIEVKKFRDLGINNDCVQALEEVLCSQAVPRCLADGSRNYGDVSKLCQNVYNLCPRNTVDALKRTNFCQKLKTGEQPKSPCVAATTRITGVCPQPKYKMPSEFLSEYRQKSSNLVQAYDQLRKQRYENGNRIYSDECISQLGEVSCSPLYCSEDESQLLVKHDRDDCNRIVNECFDEVLSKLSGSSSSVVRINALALKQRLKSQCDTYPEASTAQLKPEPLLVKQLTSAGSQPTSAGSQPTSAGSCQFGQPILTLTAITYFISKIYP